VGLVEGLTWQEIVRGMRYGNTELRLVAIRAENGALVLDDTYNASPESMLAALNLLDEMEGRKIAVLGSMPGLGPYDRQGHEMVGLRAAQVADEIVVIGARARVIAAAARSAWKPANTIFAFDDITEALHHLRERLTKHDVVLIKGPRSLQMDQIAAQLEGTR